MRLRGGTGNRLQGEHWSQQAPLISDRRAIKPMVQIVRSLVQGFEQMLEGLALLGMSSCARTKNSRVRSPGRADAHRNRQRQNGTRKRDRISFDLTHTNIIDAWSIESKKPPAIILIEEGFRELSVVCATSGSNEAVHR